MALSGGFVDSKMLMSENKKEGCTRTGLAPGCRHEGRKKWPHKAEKEDQEREAVRDTAAASRAPVKRTSARKG